jgi:hypothetical protein
LGPSRVILAEGDVDSIEGGVFRRIALFNGREAWLAEQVVSTLTVRSTSYMTNYATKHDVSQHQLILTAATLKRALEDAKSVADLSDTQLRIRRLDMDKFALRSFNRLCSDREISGPQAASNLLGHPDFYTPSTTVRLLNLRHLRYRLDHVLAPGPSSGVGKRRLG